jgi:RecB family exonuclease
MPGELVHTRAGDALTETAEDAAALPCTLPADGAPLQLRGGSALLTAQSQCAFKAFAIGRLDASSWNPAEHALTPPERGQLLHAVLHRVWSGPPVGIRSLAELRSIPDLESFVSAHVDAALSAKALARIRDEMPARYLELEARRLTRLVAEWLRYERTRVDFTVVQTEFDQTTTIGKLNLSLRIDRIDRLNDGTLLVIDYKTGNVSQKSWDLPRPDDVQLPLYAGFGLASDETVGGLAFAKVRAGEMCFAGRVANAKGTLDNTLTGASSLIKYPMSAEQLMDWRDAIERLARDFMAGRADVDPRDPVQTCEACGLQTLCRIHERPSPIDPEAEEADE